MKKNYNFYEEESSEFLQKPTTPKKREVFEKARTKFLNFFSVFQIEKSLIYPEIFETLEDLMKILISEIAPINQLIVYVKELILVEFKRNIENINESELFFLRILCSMYQENYEKEKLQEVYLIIEDFFPNMCSYCQYFRENL